MTGVVCRRIATAFAAAVLAGTAIVAGGDAAAARTGAGPRMSDPGPVTQSDGPLVGYGRHRPPNLRARPGVLTIDIGRERTSTLEVGDMLQGVIGLVMVASMGWIGVRALTDPEAIWRRRTAARGGSTEAGPTPQDLRRIKNVGIVTIALAVVFGIAMVVLVAKISSLESDLRDVEQDPLGAPTEVPVPAVPAVAGTQAP